MTRQAAVRFCPLRCLAALLILSSALPALAAPSITNVSPRGLQIGQPTTLVVSGSDLPTDAQLIVDAKIASQSVKPGAKPDRLEIEVTLDPATPPGLYPIRIAGAGGISGPLVVGVDRLPQIEFPGSLDKLPVALHGAVGSGQILKLTLAGRKDQRVVLDVESQRLGSGLKPVVRLYDPRGTQIAWSPPRLSIGGDARIDARLPVDGQYAIELHDELFRPTGPGYFRLKVGDLNYADLALPLGATAGGKQAITFTSASLHATAELDASSVTVPGETAAPLPVDERFSGAPRVAISEFAELVEMPSAGGPLQELLQLPVGVSGVVAAAGEEDKFLLTVKPGQKLAFEVIARQFGSPLDGVLTIRDEQGKQLATGDDRPGSSDPLVDFTVPANFNKLQLAIKDLLGRGGNDFVYRIVVRDTARADFALSLASDRINVPAGGTQVVPVQVARMNYNGPIELALASQAAELQVQGNVIAPGATIGLLTVSAQNVSPQAGLTRLVGKATEGQPAVARGATFGDVPGSRYQPRIRGDLGVAITRPSPVSIAWLPGDNDQLYLGGKLPARVQLTRAEGTKGKIRLRLLTSYPTPKKTVMEGKQKQKQEKTVDDLERTLRLEGDATFGPDQKDVTVNILVPADLPRKPWDLVLVAELLSADGKNVVSSLAAPVRTLSPVSPFTLALTGANSGEGKAGVGEAAKLAGKINRSPGYTQGIVVTLDGLPKGFTAPQVLVPGDKSDFELPLIFTYGSKAGELKGAKVVAISAPVTVKSVRSNAIDVAINVVAGEKPALEQPKEVFEDDEKFIALLTEGEGRAIPDQRDTYSGKYALRVTPDQKFNAQLPNLGVKIRENPGPGEYRYIRFAWKKAQGNAVCLQLAHDGKFGPPEGGSSASGREGAKFRYHSGSGDECFGASLQISDKLPGPKFELVTRDLFLDFGEFTFTGLAFSPVDGQAALFDHIYLARQIEDFSLINVQKGP